MTQPLFLDEQLVFEKTASEVTLSDNPEEWAEGILQELHKQVPYIADFEPHLQMEKVEAERGYGMGAVIVSNRTEAHKRSTSQQLKNAGIKKVMIPVIVKDGKLQPMDIILAGEDKILPLTEGRLRQALFRPNVFDVTGNTPGDQSMVGKLYPPLRDSYGYGGGGTTTGMGKMGSVKQATLIEQYLSGNNPAETQWAKDSVERNPETGEEKVLTRAGEGWPKLGSAEQLGSLLDEVLPTISQSDHQAFMSTLRDNAVKASFIKNAEATNEALQKLLHYEPKTLKAYEFLGKVASPNVIQVSKAAKGYNVKVANSRFWEPRTTNHNRHEVVATFGEKVAMEADMSGAATMVEGAEATEVEDPAADSPSPIHEFGLYRVRTDDDRELSGFVIPNLLDITGESLPISLFTNGSESAVQGDVVGVRAGDGSGLPEGSPPGTGSFYEVLPNGRVQATLPMTLTSSSSSPEGTVTFMGETYDGRPVSVSIQPNIKEMVPGETLLIPEHFKWLPLGDSDAVGLMSSEADAVAKEAAQKSFASIELRGGGADCFSLSGIPLDKIAHAEKSMVSVNDALFLMCGLGVDPAYGIKKLAEAYEGQRPVRVRIGRMIRTADSVKKASVKKAAESLRGFPYELKKNLVKEAAIVPDPSAVDTVLSLGFINPENLTTFISYLPKIEESQTKLCELLMAARLGLNEVPVYALERAIRSTEEVIEGLKTIAFQQ